MVLPVRHHESCVVKPNLFRFEFRDEEILTPVLVNLGAPVPPGDIIIDVYNLNTVQRPHPVHGGTVKAIVRGPEKDHLWFSARQPRNYVDRDQVDIAANWGTIGGLTVTAVYRKTRPYDWGHSFDTIVARDFESYLTVMRHEVYVLLSGNLAEGTHTVTPPPLSNVPAFQFVWNARTTRNCAIKVDMGGHAADDDKMIAQLSHWAPGYGSEAGAVEFPVADFPTAYLMNDANCVVHTFPITQKVAPNTAEPSPFAANIKFPDWGSKQKITGRGSGGSFIVAGHGYSVGQELMFRASGTVFGDQVAGNISYVVSEVVGVNEFKVAGVTSGTYQSGQWHPNYENWVHKCVRRNRAATYVYDLDYKPDDFVIPPGNYKIGLPGAGVSDTFRIDDCMGFEQAVICAAGEYNQRNGQALQASRYGFEQPVNMTDSDPGPGADMNGFGREVYWSYMPSTLNNESQSGIPEEVAANGVTPRYAWFALAGAPDWITPFRARGWSAPWQDAGDFDSQLFAHTPSMIEALQMLHDAMPAASRNIVFPNHPVNTEILDPVIYAGTDNVPSVVQMATYYHEPFRKLQDDGTLWPMGASQLGGGVPGGMTLSGSNTAFLGGSVDGGRGVPKHIMTRAVVINAPDPAGNFMYAAIAAMLGRIYLSYGHTAVGNMWKQSALDAVNWAEEAFLNNTSRTNYLATTLDIGNRRVNFPVNVTGANATTNIVNCAHGGKTGDKFKVANSPGTLPGGLTDGNYYNIRAITSTTCTMHPTSADALANTNIVDITSAGTPAPGTVTTGQMIRYLSDIGVAKHIDNYINTTTGQYLRYCAAGAMFKCFGASDPDGAYWGNIIKNINPAIGYTATFGIWEYVTSLDADPARVPIIRSALASGRNVDTFNVYDQQLSLNCAYRTMGTATSVFYGPGASFGAAWNWCKYHVISRDNAALGMGAAYDFSLYTDPVKAQKALDVMQFSIHYARGVNQENRSYTNWDQFPRDFATTVLHRMYKEYGNARSPNGISIYGQDRPGLGFWRGTDQLQNHQGGGIFGFATTELPGINSFTTGDKVGQKTIDPHWRAYPPFEQSLECPGFIFCMEYTTEQNIYPHLLWTAYPHFWNGRTTTARAPNKYRMIMQQVA